MSSHHHLGPEVRRLLGHLSGGDGAGAITVGDQGSPAGHRIVDAFLAVPHAARPRFLVPALPGRAAAASLLAHLGLRDRRARRRRRIIAALARTGLLGSVGQRVTVWRPAAPAGNTQHEIAFSDHLRETLGRPEAVVALGVPDVDSHYKPTLQLFDRAGRPIAFAKLGWTSATADMVRREAAALEAGAGEAGPLLRAPALLAAGVWEGSPYLVTAPLPSGARRVDADDPGRLRAARRLAGDLTTMPLTASGYWRGVRDRVAVLDDPEERALAEQAVDILENDAPTWEFGRWHGDWVPWNTAREGEVWHAWDWEHSADEVPWGFDLLHWAVTVPLLTRDLPFGSCVQAGVKEIECLLPDVDAGALVLAYLVELALRQAALRAPATEVGAAPDTVRDRVAVPEVLYPGLFSAIREVATRRRVTG